MVKIKIIIGSRRPGRFGPQPAQWIAKMGEQFKDQATFEIVDLQELDLPFYDEPGIPSMTPPEKEHTKQWAKIVGEADGFVFITSEYNHSYAPNLKNAIDFLWHEWAHKPVGFVSYGSAEGGSRAVEHLRDIVGFVKMYDLSEHVALHNYFKDLDEEGNFQFNEMHEQKATALLESLVFWSEEMKESRKKLETTQK